MNTGAICLTTHERSVIALQSPPKTKCQRPHVLFFVSPHIDSQRKGDVRFDVQLTPSEIAQMVEIRMLGGGRHDLHEGRRGLVAPAGTGDRVGGVDVCQM